jgi:hypothetical protein
MNTKTLIQKLADSKLITEMSKSKMCMNAFGSLFGSIQIWTFLMGWLFMLVGLSYACVLVYMGYVTQQAFFGVLLMIVGSIPVMTINYMRFMIAGRVWHALSFAPAAFMYLASVAQLYSHELITLRPAQALAYFVVWLFGLHIGRVLWVRYAD